MVHKHTVAHHGYRFADLRTLLAKASPPRSGDILAGIAADGDEERAAARHPGGRPIAAEDRGMATRMEPSHADSRLAAPGGERR